VSTARWILELQRQLRRGKHVVLHGSVADLVLYDGGFHRFEHALDQALAECGYTLRAAYDVADGLTFPDAQMAIRFAQLERDPRLERQPTYAPPGGLPPVGGNGPVTYYREPDVALPALRAVLAGAQREAVAGVVRFADRLFGGGDYASPADRVLMVHLAHAADEAHCHQSEGMAGMRNALVLVAPHLAQVPRWIYHGNPLFQLVAVERPDGAARRRYLTDYHDAFHRRTPGPPAPQVVEDFTALTDGLSLWDLEAVRLASQHQRLPLEDARRLVDFFKHGVKDDPWEQIDRSVLAGAREQLRRRVIGQDRAVDAVLDVLVKARGGVQVEGAVTRSLRPKGVLFLVGPTGVGKTELAKALTELVFRDPTAFARFDMSEYSMEHAADRLTGAPPGFVGYERGGQLTNRVKRRPFSLILFDEIEKAHPRIMDKFLQVLDDGRLTDGIGETAYFSQACILFTSNIGSTRTEPGAGHHERIVAAVDPSMSYEALARHFRDEVRAHFLRMGRPELLGRIGEENVVVFDMLRPEHIAAVLRKFLAGVAESARERHGVELVFDDSLVALAEQACAEPEVLVLGGRGVRNFVDSRVLVPVNRAMVDEGAPGRRFLVAAERRGVVVTRTEAFA
jgi:energy-coupling factor transporter ATP-binding protein EcfA2